MLYLKKNKQPKNPCKLKKGFQAKVKKTEQRDTINLVNSMEKGKSNLSWQ